MHLGFSVAANRRLVGDGRCSTVNFAAFLLYGTAARVVLDNLAALFSPRCPLICHA
jgi:hypothetical protein